MKVAIETNDSQLAHDLMQSRESIIGSKIKIPGEATITCDRYTIRRTHLDPYLIELTISFSLGVTSSMIASWLYEKLKGRASKIRIKRTMIELNEDQIRKFIEEEIETEN